MNNIRQQNILALSFIKGVGSVFIKKHLLYIKMYAEDLEMLGALGGKVSLDNLKDNIYKAEKIFADCEEMEIGILSIVEENYPKNLLEIKDPPPILYYKGDISLLDRAIGVIGSRKSSELGNAIAGKIGLFFSKEWSVCNGLVDGIDKNAILINDVIIPRVIGVLSGGLNYKYTSSKVSQLLAEKVLEKEGLILSESEPNKKEDQFSGSKASRIQAGLSKALILIQSSDTGGSKYTLKAFSSLSRPLGIVEYASNEEYASSDIFCANRSLLRLGKQGIMDFCDIKKIVNISISRIVALTQKEDYYVLENEISKSEMENKSFGGLF